MPKITTTIFLAFICICAATRLNGQTIPNDNKPQPIIPNESRPQPIIPKTQKAVPIRQPGDAGITNRSAKDLVFVYSFDSINWNKSYIESGETKLIHSASAYPTWFKISTNNTIITYLISDKNYFISWNSEKKVWDLYKTEM